MSQTAKKYSFSPLLIVGVYFAALLVLANFLPLTAQLQRAMLLVEFSLAFLLFTPDNKSRRSLLHSLLWHSLTWGAVCAAASTVQFLSGQDVFWQSRFLSLCAWVGVSGGLALGARLKGDWPTRIRIILLALFTLPPLWNYLTLEYAGKTVANLTTISPLWALQTGGNCWALLSAGVVGWLIALGFAEKSAAKLVVIVALLLLSTPLLAQDEIELLNPQFGRLNTWAPARVRIKASSNSDQMMITSHAPGVSLRLETSQTQRGDAIAAVIPVFLGEGAYLKVNGRRLDIEVPMPRRPVPADYNLPYVAVFAPDSINARGYLPTSMRRRFCDFYSDSQFFTDWRYLDGYDAIVLFHPQGANLPTESSKVLAQFASLGGTVIVIGSFQFEANAAGLPAPSEPTALQFQNQLARRFGYGAGAIYRLGWTDLRDSSHPAEVIDQLIQNQRWFGAKQAPAGKPDHRALSVNPLQMPNQGAFDNPPSISALALMCGLIFILLVIPVAAGRARKSKWLVPSLVFSGIVGVVLVGNTMPEPRPTAELATIVFGDGQPESPASARYWLQIEQPTTLNFTLGNKGEQPLARPFHAGEWMGLQIDVPLVGGVDAGPHSVEMQAGRVNGLSFRRYVTAARKNATPFDSDQAQILEWWLENNAWRGRSARVGSGKLPLPDFVMKGLKIRRRGVLLVTNGQK